MTEKKAKHEFKSEDAEYLLQYYRICRDMLNDVEENGLRSPRAYARHRLKKLNVKFESRLSPGILRKSLLGSGILDGTDGWMPSLC